jgi:carbonic anhydrase
MVRVIVSCMDYRLSEEILKRAGNDALILRNAGANVNGLKEALRSLGDQVDEVIYLPHTDCAALKLVYSAIKEGKQVDPEIEEKLVRQFRDKNFQSLQDLEKINAELGESTLKAVFPKAKVTTQLIDVTKIKIPERKPKYYLLKPQSRYSGDVIGAYVIQAPDRSHVTADIKIAESLNLKLEKSEI